VTEHQLFPAHSQSDRTSAYSADRTPAYETVSSDRTSVYSTALSERLSAYPVFQSIVFPFSTLSTHFRSALGNFCYDCCYYYPMIIILIYFFLVTIIIASNFHIIILLCSETCLLCSRICRGFSCAPGHLDRQGH
jgi:hypothetical protein